jgi:hypothetical protein
VIADGAQLGLPTDELGCLLRQVVGDGFERPQRGKVGSEVRGQDLEQPLASGQVAKPMLPEVAELDSVGHAPLDHGAGRVRDHDLPAVGGGHDPGGAVEVEANVAGVRDACFAGVETDANLQGQRLRPLLRGEGTLNCDGGGHRVPGAGKDGEERVPLRAHLDCRASGERLAQDSAVPLEDVRVVGSQGLEQPRGALDVAEEEGNRPGRCRASHRSRPILGSFQAARKRGSLRSDSS